MAKNPDGFIEERIEQLYVCDQYKLFFLTGQAQGAGRRAYISVKPFHTVSDEAREEIMKSATRWTAQESRVTISADPEKLSFRDGCTGTVSTLPVGELDDEVQQRLRCNITDPFQKYAGNGVSMTPTKTARDISVGRPLSLKRNP